MRLDRLTEDDEFIAVFDEDARQALTAVLQDCRHLCEPLRLASRAMSVEFTRGWRPAERTSCCIGRAVALLHARDGTPKNWSMGATPDRNWTSLIENLVLFGAETGLSATAIRATEAALLAKQTVKAGGGDAGAPFAPFGTLRSDCPLTALIEECVRRSTSSRLTQTCHIDAMVKERSAILS
ncbi:hypothetical protein E9677_10675 [Rhizobium rhizophilum]|uniref:Uncharacterized protein n=1 Tax=Rhizobium rhizophilum TaxID=1850373 RepID=A0ABY2QYJ4_9HYPH|nr:hypothetical protein E9677_10675 [Rhizobium rhizophilum]